MKKLAGALAALVTVSLLLGTFLPASAVGQAAALFGRVQIVGPVEVLGIPAAHEMTRVKYASPFTVPAGKLFVVTGVCNRVGGLPGGPNYVRVQFNGATELEVRPPLETGLMVAVPPGLVAPAGTVITVIPANTSTDPAPQVLGYLTDG